LNAQETRLLEEVIGAEPPLLCLQTGTTVDAGGWMRQVPLWLCVTRDDLVLLAVDRRRYARKISLAECGESEYAAVTGELILKPAPGLEFNRIALAPAAALKVLEQVRVIEIIDDEIEVVE
jgi:hypothetical protein